MGKKSEKLAEQILEDARKKAKPIRRRAKRKADNIVEDAKEEAEERRASMREEAAEQAEEEAQRILARADLEVANIRRRGRESILDGVRELATEKLEEIAGSDDHVRSLAVLTARSLASMTGENFELVLPEGEREERGEEILSAARELAKEEIDREISLELADEPHGRGGGLIVRKKDGRQLCDQRYASRMDRLWPSIRREISHEVLEGLEDETVVSPDRSERNNQSESEQDETNE